MTDHEYPVTIAMGHPQGGLDLGAPAYRIPEEIASSEVLGSLVGVPCVDYVQRPIEPHEVEPDFEGFRSKVAELMAEFAAAAKPPSKPKRAGRRRSRQVRSKRPRSLARAIARGVPRELATAEHLAHGGRL